MYVSSLRIVVKDRSGVAVDTGIVRRMVIIATTLGKRPGLACWRVSVSVTGFSSIE